MPAFSFKERFVPMVQDDTKDRTVRDFRKHPVKVGQLAHLYYAMRTKQCKKLKTLSPPIKDVKSIIIYPDGVVCLLETNWISKFDRIALKHGKHPAAVLPDVPRRTLNQNEKDDFAWHDGFRHDADYTRVNGCWVIMRRYWTINNTLPFVGFVTYWK